MWLTFTHSAVRLKSTAMSLLRASLLILTLQIAQVSFADQTGWEHHFTENNHFKTRIVYDSGFCLSDYQLMEASVTTTQIDATNGIYYMSSGFNEHTSHGAVGECGALSSFSFDPSSINIAGTMSQTAEVKHRTYGIQTVNFSTDTSAALGV